MSTKGPLSRFELVRRWDDQRTERGWWHSFELPDGSRIDGVCDLAGLQARIAQFPIPQNLRGKRVLDIGAWDGWFSFEMERRGAEVLAIDNWDNPRFHEMRARLDSRVEYRQIDMYDLTPASVGRFDIVLFMGVLYHLKHPLLALERVCALTTELAAVDSFVLREKPRRWAKEQPRALMEFYETAEFGGQTDNWVGPNLACLMAFCRTAGFARVELESVLEHSACVACFRQWQPPAAEAPAGPELLGVEHNTNGGINFDSSRDESVSAWFGWPARTLMLDDVQPEAGGFGGRAFHIARVAENQWQTNFKLPPGLTAGWHDVRIRVGGSLPGSVKRIAVDVPLTGGEVRIQGVCDGTTWVKEQLDLSRGDALSLWLSGLPDNADGNNLRVTLDGRRLPVTFLEPPGGSARQVNAQVPSDCATGVSSIGVALGGIFRDRAEIEVRRGLNH
jgi:tRNA (mo5U34)-methyltransferase